MKNAALALLVLVAPHAASGFVAPGRLSARPDFDVRPRLEPGAPGAARPDAKAAAELGRIERIAGGPVRASWDPLFAVPSSLHAWGRPLSRPARTDAEAAARRFVRDHAALFGLPDRDVADLVLVRRHAAPGSFEVVWLGQEVDGLPVDGAHIRVAVAPDGSVLWAGAGALVADLRSAAGSAVAVLSPEAALSRALADVGVAAELLPERTSPAGSRVVTFSPGGLAAPPAVESVRFPLPDRTAPLAWRAFVHPPRSADAYAVTVDAASGRLLQRASLTRYVTNEGLVFDGPYPAFTPLPPGTPVAGVPQGRRSFGWRWPSTTGYTTPAPWGEYNLLVGNNVTVEEDWTGDFVLSRGRRADGGALQEFLFPFQDALRASTGSTVPARVADAHRDVDAGMTNLFWWLNRWHDETHALGFDEASGNMQMDNFSRGGCGGDGVLAFAQWASEPPFGLPPQLNNAFFITAPEAPGCAPGLPRPVTAFLLFDSPAFGVADSLFEADVILHEYTHGVSTRLVGGPTVSCLGGTQSGAMGEGWSDWFPASFFDDPVVGEYVTNNTATGIRLYPMDANPRTYADLCTPVACEVHQDGEIHASTLWDLRAAVGRTVAERLVMDALKLVPCSPSFLDYRDALLLADQARFGGAHRCAIWDAYLARGMGFEAQGSDSAFHVADFVFDAPACSGLAHLRYDAHATSDVAGGNGDGLYAPGETIDLVVSLHNRDGASTARAVSATVATTTPGITMVRASASYPDIAVGASADPVVPFQFRVDPGFVCGTPIDFTVVIDWAPALRRADPFRDAGGSVPTVPLPLADADLRLAATGGVAAVSTAQNHTPGGSASYHLVGACYAGDDATCAGPCNATCGTLTLAPLSLPAGQTARLVFWATYNLESFRDGLLVELSEDGGLTWQRVDDVGATGLVAASSCSGRVEPVPAITGPPGNAALAPWTQFAAGLAPWAGRDVVLRLLETNDACGYFAGAWVDDVALEVRQCSALPFVATALAGRTWQDGVDPACSDGDGRPDAGETADVSLVVLNTGTDVARGMTATLSASSPAVTILNSPLALGDVAPGAAATAVFRVQLATTGLACLEEVDFTLALSANAGAFTATHPFTETVRADGGVLAWTDGFAPASPAWTAASGPTFGASDFTYYQLQCVPLDLWSTWTLDPVFCIPSAFYSDNSDSLLTSPPIDLGSAGARLLRASWTSYGFPTLVGGLVEVSIDHDDNGSFTLLWRGVGGLGVPDPATQGYAVDIQANPAGNPVPPATTARTVRFRFRFLSLTPQLPFGGMVIDDFRLEWQPCDANVCAPGAPNGSAGTGATLPGAGGEPAQRLPGSTLE